MLEDELSVSTREREGVAIIDLVGDVTTFAEEKINNAYAQVTNQGAKYILMNFRQNDYINSAGIASQPGWLRHWFIRHPQAFELQSIGLRLSVLINRVNRCPLETVNLSDVWQCQITR